MQACLVVEHLLACGVLSIVMALVLAPLLWSKQPVLEEFPRRILDLILLALALLPCLALVLGRSCWNRCRERVRLEDERVMIRTRGRDIEGRYAEIVEVAPHERLQGRGTRIVFADGRKAIVGHSVVRFSELVRALQAGIRGATDPGHLHHPSRNGVDAHSKPMNESTRLVASDGDRESRLMFRLAGFCVVPLAGLTFYVFPALMTGRWTAQPVPVAILVGLSIWCIAASRRTAGGFRVERESAQPPASAPRR